MVGGLWCRVGRLSDLSLRLNNGIIRQNKLVHCAVFKICLGIVHEAMEMNLTIKKKKEN